MDEGLRSVMAGSTLAVSPTAALKSLDGTATVPEIA